MSTKFFTNQDNHTLFNKFKGIFKHNEAINHFDVLVGYFHSSGYFKLRPLLENVANIRILVGIDVDKIAKEMKDKGLALFKGNTKETIEDWQSKFISDIKEANYDETTEQGIMQFVTDMQTNKVQLKAHPSQNIHAKLYIFRPDNFNEHNAGSSITGSSNLTNVGLGITQNPNYEFNVLLNDYADIHFATSEFEKLWAEGTDILPEAAQTSIEKTHLADTITPYELYLKCLVEYFGTEVEFDPNSIKDLPGSFKRLSYQIDAVSEGWEKLKKHNGFFLSDVVGLGKTVVAILIARQFYYHNGFPDHRSRLLLVIPPALKQNWKDTLKTFKLDDAVTIITTGSLHKVDDAKKYDMVIVDEAHKFRNDTSDAYDNLQRICKTKTERNKDKKVILVSATPLNNRPDDLYNQILLFQDGNQSTLDLNLARFFTKAIKEYKSIPKLNDKDTAREHTEKLYKSIRERVIAPLMVRRTRTDLLTNERYKQDITKQGIVFPKTTPPQPIYYQLEPEVDNLYNSTIKRIDNKQQDETGLLYTRYRILYYLKPKFKQKYKQADFITERLVAIMKTLLLKRMDSSFYAFKKTLGRFITSSEVMLTMIDNNRIIIAPNINISEYILEGREEELIERLANESLTDPSIEICSCDDFEAGFIAGVKQDYHLLTRLKDEWEAVAKDPKIDEFLHQLPKMLDKSKNPEQKIVIFTESSDTMGYLSEQMKSTQYGDKTLSVNSKNRSQLKQTIEQNFDANSKHETANDYQIIITTEVLSEGVNLHRANTVVNYDTPWNASKLMQRIGRVNRIGQQASHIFVYNFYPTEQINSDIGLEKRALIKLQAFHSALGEDSQIYSTDEKVGSFGIFDEDIQEEKNELIPFLEEIRAFKRDEPEQYKHIKGLPSKVRNAVANSTHKDGTIVFARTQDRGSSRFYLVKDKVESYGFIDTARLLKCSPDTKSRPLHPQHYPQVISALEHFNNEIEQDIISQTQDKVLSPHEIKAIKFLKSMLNPSITDKSEQKKIALAITHIENKRFNNLTRDINKLSRKIKDIKQVKVLERTLAIIKGFDLNSHVTADSDEQQPTRAIDPVIVISQSYT